MLFLLIWKRALCKAITWHYCCSLIPRFPRGSRPINCTQKTAFILSFSSVADICIPAARIECFNYQDKEWGYIITPVRLLVCLSFCFFVCLFVCLFFSRDYSETNMPDLMKILWADREIGSKPYILGISGSYFESGFWWTMVSVHPSLYGNNVERYEDRNV